MAIKILNVVWDNRMGGVQRRVVLAARELREHNLETILVAPREEGYFSQLAAEEGLKVYQVTLKRPHHFDKPSSILFNLLWFLVFPYSVFLIARIIRREHISILHTNGLLNLQAPVAALLMRRKIVWHLVGSIYPRPLLRLLMPFIRLVSDRIVLIAERMSPYYLGKPDSSLAEKVTIIHDPVDTARFNPANIPAEVKRELAMQFHVNPGDRIVGCIGNINPAKGYEYLLRSAGLVKKRYDEVRFIIVGMKLETQKAYYRSLRDLVSSLALEEYVAFAGERHDIPQILSLFDLFVLPSVTEGTPVAILEAMAMEKPIVATNVGAVTEQITDGETGMIVPPRDPVAMAEAIIYLLEHPEEAISMGKKARNRAREFFSLETCVLQHIKLYDDVMNGRKRIET